MKTASFCSSASTPWLVLGLEQLLHSHRFVDVVLGPRDLFTCDQEPHVRMNQVLRAGPAGRVELRQRELRGWQALFGSFLTDRYSRFIVPTAIFRA
jgi:hypothetical protein